jgi:hypothetical protein
MTEATGRRAAAIGFQSGVLLGVQLRRAAGIAVREGLLAVVGLRAGVVAMIVEIAVAIAEVIAARGRIEAGDRGRNSRAPQIATAVSRGSTVTSGRRSRRRIG